MLLPECLGELDARDFRHGVPLIRRFERTCEQLGNRHGLRRVFGIDAARSQHEQLSHPVSCRRADHGLLDREVVEQEIGGIARVGLNAADFRGRERDNVGASAGDPVVNCWRVAKVQRRALNRKHLDILHGEATHERGSDHATVPRDPYAVTRKGHQERSRHVTRAAAYS
jgi:hypothetical protein